MALLTHNAVTVMSAMTPKGPIPLDGRLVVKSTTDLTTLYNNSPFQAYQGMEVMVSSTNPTLYRFIGSSYSQSTDIAKWKLVDIADAFTTSGGGTTNAPLRSTGGGSGPSDVMTAGAYRALNMFKTDGEIYDVAKEFNEPGVSVDAYAKSDTMMIFYSNVGGKVLVHNTLTGEKYNHNYSLGSTNIGMAVTNGAAFLHKLNSKWNYGVKITDGGKTLTKSGDFRSSTVRSMHISDDKMYVLSDEYWRIRSSDGSSILSYNMSDSANDGYTFSSHGGFLFGVNHTNNNLRIIRQNPANMSQIDVIRAGSTQQYLRTTDDVLGSNIKMVADQNRYIVYATPTSYQTSQYCIQGRREAEYSGGFSGSSVRITNRDDIKNMAAHPNFQPRTIANPNANTTEAFMMEMNTGRYFGLTVNSGSASFWADYHSRGTTTTDDFSDSLEYGNQMYRVRGLKNKFTFNDIYHQSYSYEMPMEFSTGKEEALTKGRVINSNEWDGGIERIIGGKETQVVMGIVGANRVIKLYRYDNTTEILYSQPVATAVNFKFNEGKTIFWWTSTTLWFKDPYACAAATSKTFTSIRDVQTGSGVMSGSYAVLDGNDVKLSTDAGSTFATVYTKADIEFMTLEGNIMLGIMYKSTTKADYYGFAYKPSLSEVFIEEDTGYKYTGPTGTPIDLSESFTMSSPNSSYNSTITLNEDGNVNAIQSSYAGNRVTSLSFHGKPGGYVQYRNGISHRLFTKGSNRGLTNLDRKYYYLEAATYPVAYSANATGYADGHFGIFNTDGFYEVKEIDETGNVVGDIKVKEDSVVIVNSTTPKFAMQGTSYYSIDKASAFTATFSGTEVGAKTHLRVDNATALTMNGTILSGTFNPEEVNVIETTCVNELGDDTSYEHVITSAAGGGGGGMFDTITPMPNNASYKNYRNTENKSWTDGIGIGLDAIKDNDAMAVVGIGDSALEGSAVSAACSVGIGYDAGCKNTGLELSALGYKAGCQNVGSQSVAIGSVAGACNTGVMAVSIGKYAGVWNTGDGLISIGERAGYQNSKIQNTFIGTCAGMNYTQCAATALGHEAGMCGGGQYSVAIGIRAGKGNACHRNVMIGRDTGVGANGSSTISIGDCANMCALRTDGSVSIGDKAGLCAAASNGSVFIGQDAGACSTCSGGTVNVGSQAGCRSMSQYSVNVGYTAGTCVTGTSSTRNVFIGSYAGNCSNVTYSSVVIGNGSGCCMSGSGTFIGTGSGLRSSGSGNTVIGGGGSMLCGNSNLLFNGSGSYLNGCYNYGAGPNVFRHAVGDRNFVFGFCAGDYLEASDVIGIGHRAGFRATSSGSILLNSTSKVAYKVILPKPALAGAGSNFHVYDHGFPTGTNNVKVIGAGFGLIDGQNVSVTTVDENNFTIAENLTVVGETGDVKLQFGTPLSNISILNPKKYDDINDANIPKPTASNEMHYGNKEIATHKFYGNVECTGEFVGTGGGPTPTLQDVTDAGNSTTNNIVTTGTATASNFILSSDERLKTFKNESIVDVSSIDIRKFTYNDDETNRDRYGVSAQELQKVAPEMVYEDTNEDGTLRVGYIDFLLAEISNLRDRLNKLEGK